MNSIMSYMSNLSDGQQLVPAGHTFINGQLITTDDTSLINRHAENLLLNRNARTEYDSLKRRIIGSALEMNKFLELDDQIGIQEYKLCTSLRYRKQFFAMEFKQIPTDESLCNHALDLIFQNADRSIGKSGRTTLILMRDHYLFSWRPLHQVLGGPAGSSNVLARLVLLWLQNGQSLFSP